MKLIAVLLFACVVLAGCTGPHVRVLTDYGEFTTDTVTLDLRGMRGPVPKQLEK